MTPPISQAHAQASGLELLSYLDPEDRDALLYFADERVLDPGEVLIEQGQPHAGLFIVMQGLLDVRVGSDASVSLGRRGPGQLLGELSFLTGDHASATVAALEATRVLALPQDMLGDLLGGSAVFAARFYQMLGKVVAGRLAESARRTLPVDTAITHSPELDAELRLRFDELSSKLEALEAEIGRHREMGGAALERMKEIWAPVMGFVRHLFSEESGLPPALHDDCGRYVRQRLMPYINQSAFGARAYSKPRGYAGDYKTIDQIYAQEPDGTGHLGPLMDAVMLALPGTHAVRNRRGLLVGLFEDLRESLGEEADDDHIQITSLACGPAREIFDFFEAVGDPKKLMVNCVDIDFEALAFVGQLAEKHGLKRRIRMHQESLIHVAAGRGRTVLRPQHMIYSIGLIDYFDDKFVVQLLNWIHESLRPGGWVVLGNFHPSNPDRPIMDHILNWPLVYRTEEDMRRIFADSKFGDRPVDVRYEEQGINLFARSSRPKDEAATQAPS